MKKLSILILFVSVYASDLCAGELVYRDDYIKPGCTAGYHRVGQCGLVHSLQCFGKNVRTVYAGQVCATPGGFTETKDAINYEFNDNYRSDALGAVSLRSNNNVFSARSLDNNYRAFSSEGILDKPVILVEGYDSANEVSPSGFYNNGFSRLVYGGRDLFVVNLNSADKSIDENAVILQQIIQEINSAKVGNHPMAVIGYSMGGVVARKALKNMENSGINHRTSLYVSWDAPHMGANFQKSIEDTVEKLIDKIDDRSFGYTPSALKRARNNYTNKTAQEMIFGASRFRAATMSDFPNNLVRVAVTSGSLKSEAQQYSVYEGEQVGYFNMTLSTKILGVTTTLSETSTLVGGRRGGYFYDNVPGSYLYQFDSFMNLLSSEIDVGIRQDHRVPYSRRLGFIPTFSSLAISRSPALPMKDFIKFNSPFDMYIAIDTSGGNPRVNFESQNIDGVNFPHDQFHSSQFEQLLIAMDKYHTPQFIIPDRSFKSQ